MESAIDSEVLKSMIHRAFAAVEFPGSWCLSGSNEGEEGSLVAKEFGDKSDWRVLDPEFLDHAPDGYSSALTFFSDEAFRFYLPAYLIADIDGRLNRSRPVFHLTHGLTSNQKTEKVNPRRYGARTWFEEASYRLSIFDSEQVSAIVAYLKFKRERDEFEAESIDQALANFWHQRTIEPDD